MSFDLQEAKRVVIKIGSALLVDNEGRIRQEWLNALADDIARLHKAGKQVLVVSSGSIAVGRRHLGLKGEALKLEEKQASAATGQIRLAHAYQEALHRHNITVAQMLLTPSDTEERRRHLNARATAFQLLSLGAVPIINENDTVATEEIRYGDNDRLAARVATMVSADALVLLSDIDGLYTADPRKDKNATHIPVVEKITAEIDAMAGDAPVGISTGGMVTKLLAAKLAVQGGCAMVIAQGAKLNPVGSILDGGLCTWFLSAVKPRAARKKWIAGSLTPAGSVTVDDGAVNALNAGKSLLPAGVIGVDGHFDRGDSILVKNLNGERLGVGLSAFSSDDTKEILGLHSDEVKEKLGIDRKVEVIHRDDLALEA
ncbi:glutamate 5-kinase [Curvivirga aplysinae]|uniref:glutamate 5-kinase n=1 Tax=Curvivirga aplysinae TaxID=2529852 RepID=UPI0012BD0D13|nr:glutamate 5-kinase [Curvivirga aplysinae]MTI08839.1 glutamate 5-kinase [Curvivirga aplysinae]